VSDPSRLELPGTFTFTQSNLQAFVDCPRRFWLSSIQALAWPAAELSPLRELERRLREGSQFHRLVQRHQIGIAADALTPLLELPLAEWFDAYLRHPPMELPGEFREAEATLIHSLTVDGVVVHLLARYDLICADAGGPAVIVDWKTTARPPSAEELRGRVQSMLYPMLLVEASAGLPWGAVPPEKVEMRYWFATAPEAPVHLGWDAEKQKSARVAIGALISDILTRSSEVDFPKIPDTMQNRRRHCDFCIYRSRCGRGESPGIPHDAEEVEQRIFEEYGASEVEAIGALPVFDPAW